MRLISILLLFSVLYCVMGKGGVKATESMGQEVIEIGTPIKELPPDLEEEPSAEVDDDDRPASTRAPVARKETKKTAATTKTVATAKAQTTSQARKKAADGDEEDAKIEKELEDLYKDTLDRDYKDNEIAPSSANNTQANKTENILRDGNNFRFQPNLNNKKEVERFRTSVDEISCDRGVTKLLKLKDTHKKPNAAFRASINTVLYIVSAIIIMC